jgi:hypothetical protein
MVRAPVTTDIETKVIQMIGVRPLRAAAVPPRRIPATENEAAVFGGSVAIAVRVLHVMKSATPTFDSVKIVGAVRYRHQLIVVAVLLCSPGWANRAVVGGSRLGLQGPRLHSHSGSATALAAPADCATSYP